MMSGDIMSMNELADAPRQRSVLAEIARMEAAGQAVTT